MLPSVLRKLAIINFSGRYDTRQRLAENLTHPKNMYFVEASALKIGPPLRPAKVIFKSSNQEMMETVGRLGASLRPVRNVLGEPLLTVAEFGNRPISR